MHRTDRVVLRMFGRDPLKMIQGLATNDIAGTAVGTSVYTGFLTPKGRLIGVARVVRREDGDIWIEAEAAAADNIVAHFKKSIPPLFAKFERTEWQVVELVGDAAANAAHGIKHEAVLANPFRSDALDLIVAEAPATDLPTLDADEHEMLRVRAGEPKWGAELTEDVIPLEAELRNVAISETKGCYTGQEVVVRILHRGHVNRQLRHLLLDDTDAPAPGAEISSDGKVVGQITSAVPINQHAIALGYVRREVTVGSEVQVSGHTARVQELPWVQQNQKHAKP